MVFLKRYVFKPYFRRRDLKRILIKELPVDLEDNLKKTIYKYAIVIIYAVEESLEKEIYHIDYHDLSLCTPSKVLEKVEGLVIDHFKKRLLKCQVSEQG